MRLWPATRSRRLALGLSILLLPALLSIPPLLAYDDPGSDGGQVAEPIGGTAPDPPPDTTRRDDYTQSAGSAANEQHQHEEQARVDRCQAGSDAPECQPKEQNPAGTGPAQGDTTGQPPEVEVKVSPGAWISNTPTAELLTKLGAVDTTQGEPATGAFQSSPSELALNPPAATPQPEGTPQGTEQTQTAVPQGATPTAAPAAEPAQTPTDSEQTEASQARAPTPNPGAAAAVVPPDLDERQRVAAAEWAAEEEYLNGLADQLWRLDLPSKDELRSRRELMVRHGRMTRREADRLNRVDSGQVFTELPGLSAVASQGAGQVRDLLTDLLMNPRPGATPSTPTAQGPETDAQFLDRVWQNARPFAGSPLWYDPELTGLDPAQQASDRARAAEMAKHPETLSVWQRVRLAQLLNKPRPYVPETQGPETDEEFLTRLKRNAFGRQLTRPGIPPTRSGGLLSGYLWDKKQQEADLARLQEMAKHPETLTRVERITVEWALGDPIQISPEFEAGVEESAEAIDQALRDQMTRAKDALERRAARVRQENAWILDDPRTRKAYEIIRSATSVWWPSLPLPLVPWPSDEGWDGDRRPDARRRRESEPLRGGGMAPAPTGSTAQPEGLQFTPR